MDARDFARDSGGGEADVMLLRRVLGAQQRGAEQAEIPETSPERPNEISFARREIIQIFPGAKPPNAGTAVTHT